MVKTCDATLIAYGQTKRCLQSYFGDTCDMPGNPGLAGAVSGGGRHQVEMPLAGSSQALYAWRRMSLRAPIHVLPLPQPPARAT